MTESRQRQIMGPGMPEYTPVAIAYMDGHLTRPEFVLLIDLVRLKKKARA